MDAHNDIYDTLASELNSRGIDFQLEHGSKHPRLIFDLNGRTIKFTYPLSPSDSRSGLNSLAQLKRIIGSSDNDPAFFKVSKYITATDCTVRIAFTRAALRKMFGKAAIDNDCRVSVQSADNEVTIIPSKMGHFKVIEVGTTVGGSQDSIIGFVTIRAHTIGVREGRCPYELVKPTWLAEGRSVFKLPPAILGNVKKEPDFGGCNSPVKIFDEAAELPSPTEKAVIDSMLRKDIAAVKALPWQLYSDPKAAADLLNDALAKHQDLRVKVGDDGRSVKLVKIVTIEEEL